MLLNGRILILEGVLDEYVVTSLDVCHLLHVFVCTSMSTIKKSTTFTRSAFNADAQSGRANRWLNVNTSQTEGLTATPQVS